jgi:CheY-like chemotaxis protein
VSLRILFADDSMTAQNMGKKILSDAGYDVVAVSNGAAAVKKIAEQKPDIIILDVYMPGYSGLEVCEKVRGSLDTMKTPVLLTVGKMEPYKPEDANRVKADGVIIKPFEASDLLAIIKKFEERIGQTPVPPIVEQVVRAESQYQEDPSPVIEHMAHHSMGKASSQPMVEVPDHMAGAAAFNDMLGADSSIAPHHFGVSSPAATFETSVIVPAPPIPTAEYEVPGSWKEEKPEPVAVAPPTQAEPEITATPVEVEPDPVSAEPETVAMEPLADPETNAVPAEAAEALSAAAAEPAHPQFIPIYKEPEPEPQPQAEAAPYEVMPTAAPPTGDIEIPREPELQETADETTRATVADQVEPRLLSTFEAEPEAARKSAAEEQPASWPSSTGSHPAAQEAPPADTMYVAPAQHEVAPLPAIRATGEVSDADFEARVAAAMAAYSHSTGASEVHESPVSAPVEVQPEPPAYAAQTAEVAPVEEAVPSFEYRPPVRLAEPEETISAVSLAPENSASPVSLAPEPEAPVAASVHQAVTAEVEAAAVAAATEPGADHHNIAQAVHRVMERLKPELVEEIMRELKSKK